MRRDPEAVVGADDYLIVTHTHEIELATFLMRGELTMLGRGTDSIARRLARPVTRYVRKVPALPNSYAAAEGWPYAFIEQEHPASGAFPAVIFYG